MMIGERTHVHPTVQVPPWCTLPDDPTADDAFIISPTGNDPNSPCVNISSDDYNSLLQNDALRALQRYLPSNNLPDVGENEEFDDENGDLPVDLYSCDHFRMFEFKVRKCTRSRSHDWTDCPFAHPGEKARRRDPRKYHYSGSACPEFRKGSCRKGDSCEFAHGVFECWLHPARYRTQPCKDGLNCKRRVCFFAHSPDQMRVLSPRTDSYDGSPKRLLFEGSFGKSLQFMSSPESGSPPTESPPMSPMTNSYSMAEIVTSLRQLQLNKLKTTIPSAWGFQMGGSGVGSPRLNMNRPGFTSFPTTPTHPIPQPGLGYFDAWEKNGCQEEPVMERVESGRDLRAKIFEKLSKENPLSMSDPNPDDASGPDVGWVSELLK